MNIIAHRGASGVAPENTIEAFKKAIEYPIDGIEVDIHLSKDSIPVLIHDEKIDRTTNGQGYVKDYTFEQLQQFDASNKKEGYQNCKIPSLEQLFQLVQNTNIHLYLELKTDYFFYEGIEKIVYDLVSKYHLQDRVSYSSFNHQTLKRMKILDESVRIGFLYEGIMDQPVEYVKARNGYAIHPKHTSLQIKNYVQDAINENLFINVWTVNKVEMIQECLNLGVTGIFTNYPDLALKIRNKKSN